MPAKRIAALTAALVLTGTSVAVAQSSGPSDDEVRTEIAMQRAILELAAKELDDRAAVTPEPEPTTEPTEPPTAPGKFSIGVWYQNPAVHADDYKALGVTTFNSLWNWPTEPYAGWAQKSLDELKRNGLDAYAGQSPEALKKTLTMPNNDVITAWPAGDEPDMFDVSPAEFNAKIDSLLAVEDRPIRANFGKGFGGHDWWYNHSTTDAERAEWCRQVDFPTVDYYGMTDFHEPAKNKGAWTYGRAVDNVEKACPGKPVGAFVEVTQPWKDSANAATPEGMRAAAWNSVIHGGDNLQWFIHDFHCDGECGPSAFLTSDRWADNRAAMKAINAELHSHAAALNSPDVTTGKATSTGIPLALLTKRVGGATYVFAQADGGYDAPQGYSGTATVSVGDRTFTDTWTPYQVRVYTA